MSMAEFIRTYAVYAVAAVAFIFGMAIGHTRGRIAGIREQAFMAQEQSTRELWHELMGSFKKEDKA